MQRAVRPLTIAVILAFTVTLAILVMHTFSTSGAALVGTAAPLAPTSAASVPTVVGNVLLPQAETRFSFDSVNGSVIGTDQQSPIVVTRGAPLQVRGWAVDIPNRRPASGVTLSIDNVADVPALYGEERADVVQALGDPTYLRCGFEVEIPTGQLSVGRHLIAIKIRASDARTMYQPQQAILIEIAA
jgi:hypothetical protein